LKEDVKEEIEKELVTKGIPKQIDKNLEKSAQRVTKKLLKENIEKEDITSKIKLFEESLTKYLSSLPKAVISSVSQAFALTPLKIAFMIGALTIAISVGALIISTPSNGWIEGHVYTQEGTPIGGASVYTVRGPSSGSTVTDEEGYYMLDNLDPGWYVIEAAAEGFEVHRIDEIEVLGGEGVWQDFLLTIPTPPPPIVPTSTPTPEPTPTPPPPRPSSPSGWIEGYVFDPNRGPIEGVPVYTVRGPSSGSTVTDEKGYYMLDNLDPGWYVIEAAAEGFEVRRIEIEVVGGEGVWQDFQLTIPTPPPPTGGWIEGTVYALNLLFLDVPVYTEATAEPIEGVSVYTVSGPSSGSTVTDEEGYYMLDNLDPGWYGIEAAAEGFEDQRIDQIEVVSGERVWQDFLLTIPTPPPPTGGWIEGYVYTQEEEPIEGVSVYTVYGTSSARVVTDEKGYYLLDNLDPGWYGIEAAAEGFEVQRIDQIEVVSGEGVLQDLLLTIPTPPPTPELPKIHYFEADPSAIWRGEESTLSWETSNAVTVEINGKKVSLSGSQGVSPERTTTYTLTAINEEGKVEREEITVEIIIPNGEHSISNVQLKPPSPSFLGFNQRIAVRFYYTTTEPEGVLIFLLPFTEGSPTPNYAVSESPIYRTGKGEGEGYFTIQYMREVTGNEITVDQLRFRITSTDQSRVLHESFISVNYRFYTLE
jgi:protocatechuate 3,4-dioxygenase beta subunit